MLTNKARHRDRARACRSRQLRGCSAVGSGGGVHSARATTMWRNVASLQRGARNFVNYCMGCHSAQLRALQPAGRGSRLVGSAGDREPDVHRRAHPRHDALVDARPKTQPLVRRCAAGSVADRAQSRHRLHLFVPQVVLRRSEPSHRRQQSGAARHGDAARAVGAAGLPARRLRRRKRRRAQCRSQEVQGIRAG